MLAVNPIRIDRTGVLTGAPVAWIILSVAAVVLLLLAVFSVPRLRRRCGRPILCVLLIAFALLTLRSVFHIDAIQMETSMGGGVVELGAGVLCIAIGPMPMPMEEPPVVAWFAIDDDSPQWDFFEFRLIRGNEFLGRSAYGVQISITWIATVAAGVWWLIASRRRHRRDKRRGFDVCER